MIRKIAIVSGTRAEYGLFVPLLEALEREAIFDVSIIVTGAHLSDRFGLTVNEIEADGYRIAARVPLPLDDDSEVGIARATGEAVSGIASALAAEKPDLVVVLGDRYETLAAAVAAALLCIPIAHLHGGELTEGAIDDSMRHAITKLSVLHFVSTEEYARRVIQMGEAPERVFVVGALGVDNALNTPRIAPEELGEDIGFEFRFPTALATFHPVTLDERAGLDQVDELLAAFDVLPELRVLFTMPNADAGNRAFAERIAAWSNQNAGRAKAVKSLGRVRFLSAISASDLVVGNSSSGIIEAPSFGKPTVDIGDRQSGRVTADSLLHVEPQRDTIVAALRTALSEKWRARSQQSINPYGDGGAAQRIVEVLRQTDLLSVRKRFYDIPFACKVEYGGNE